MHPILFEAGPITVYSYGFLIAVGAVLGLVYMAHQARKQFGLSYDQSNTLFILLVVAAVVGGKVFLFFEDPSFYSKNASRLFTGSGFDFYGSFLFAIPTMLWFFKKRKIPTLAMLDIMAIVTCIVHGFGRLGCFMAGCCHGTPTDSILGVIFTDPFCQAEPLHTPLHPTQLYEAALIFSTFFFLLWLKKRKGFDGQLFLIYLMIYAVGRSGVEIFRGDEARGYVIDGFLSHSQFIGLLVFSGALYFYVKLRRSRKLLKTKTHGTGKAAGKD
jgi:phosphatidylglycerol:prolipoprotein diacylglycerol transferase